MKQVYLNEFEGHSDVDKFKKAIEYLRENAGTELIVPPGDYDITSELAIRAMKNVMDGNWGANPQKIMFNPKYEYTKGIHMDGLKSCVVSAYGARLHVNGFMEPISITNCTGLEVRGFTIDHVRKPFSRGKVTDISAADADGNRTAVIEFDEDSTINEHTPMLRYFFYDTSRERNIYAKVCSHEYVNDHCVRAVLQNADEIVPGTLYYITHTYHSRPGILIENSRDIRLKDVTIHNQPGMGVVGNRCENITLSGLSVVPCPGYHMSTNTDATHFTSIKGLLRLENCVFEGQGDDFTNVHSYYQAVVGKEGERTYYIKEMTPDGTHAQTLDYPDIGDAMELSQKSTLESLGTYTVEDCVQMPDKWMCKVTLNKPLPEDTDGLLLSDVTRIPRLEVIGCTTAHQFARGILIKTRGALVEGCTLRSTQGPAIVAAAEAWWSEGICPSDITIRKNHVIGCAEVWGEAGGIVVKSDCEKPITRNIRNVVIEDNIIEAENCDHGIYLRGIEGVRISGNQITCQKEPIVIEDCSIVE